MKVVERRKLGKGDLEALRSEARLLNELDHPNIVKLHGWYEEDKTLYMALELCEGERKECRQLQARPALRCVRGVCMYICTLKCYGIVCRTVFGGPRGCSVFYGGRRGFFLSRRVQQ